MSPVMSKHHNQSQTYCFEVHHIVHMILIDSEMAMRTQVRTPANTETLLMVTVNLSGIQQIELIFSEAIMY